jgi:hypothetical protein
VIALATTTPTVRSLPRAARSLIGVAACRDEWSAHQFSTWRVYYPDGCDTELGLADCNGEAVTQGVGLNPTGRTIHA